MHDIRHRVGITAPQHRVYQMLSTKEGLAEFWTTVEGGDQCAGACGTVASHARSASSS
jgi:uncharacterized protein YndB with AHSA1/START domain